MIKPWTEVNVMEKRSKFVKSTRAIAVFIAMVMVGFAFTGCGKKKDTDTGASKKTSVVTTNYPAYDFAKKIAGDKAEVTTLLPPGADAHSYEPKPCDIKKIASADVVIGVGGVEDPWVKESVKQAWKNDDIKAGKKKAFYMLDFFKKSKKSLIKDAHHHDEHDSEKHQDTKKHEKDEHENEHKDKHDKEHEKSQKHEEVGEKNTYDPHVWLSVKNAQKVANGIAKGLEKVDPDNANYYKKNHKVLSMKLKKLKKDFSKELKKAKRKEIVVADKFPFKYMVKELGLRYTAAFKSHTSDSETSAKAIRTLINKVKAFKIPVVYVVEMSNKKIAKAVSEGTGCKILELHSCHTLTKEQMDAGEDYISIMKRNLKNLKKGLN